MPRLHAILAFLAALALLVAPVANVATAGIRWGTVECCCGEHAGDHDCGCPDCPGAQRHHRPAPADDGQPHMRACTGDVHVATPAAMTPFVAPAAIAIHVPARRAIAVAEPTITPPARVVHPLTPPS